MARGKLIGSAICAWVAILTLSVNCRAEDSFDKRVNAFFSSENITEIMSLSAEAAGRVANGQCQTEFCDTQTGCIAPAPPYGGRLNVYPDTPETRRYTDELAKFHACRKLVFSMKQVLLPNETSMLLSPLVASMPLSAVTLARQIETLNGNIFWKPASKTNDIVTQFGDEARSVFGPIPDADCTDGVGKTVQMEVDGNIVDLKPNPNKAGSPLEFQHSDVNGSIVKWTNSIPQCDKPSLAGGVTFCGLNSRLTIKNRGNVEWLLLCRKTIGLEVNTSPLWLAKDPSYQLIGTIGFNAQSGEVVFFDGRPGEVFSWATPTVSPGGAGYADDQGRAKAATIYDPKFTIACVACHDNKTSHIVDPHIEQARVGYRDQSISDKFSLGALIPEQTRRDIEPYRVIGSGYTATHKAIISTTLTVRDPSHNCTSCHGLTTGETARFAANAVRRPLIGADQGTANEISAEVAHTSDWAGRAGAGKISPWMVPNAGNDLSGEPPPSEIKDADWAKLSACLTDSGDKPECAHKQAFTTCPAPESALSDKTRIADPAGPTSVALLVKQAPAGSGFDRLLRLSWEYLNTLGNVPERDDVRFNLAVKEASLSIGTPSSSEYPSIEDATGVKALSAGPALKVIGDTNVITDVSFIGHTKWTDAKATSLPRQYGVEIPAECGKRYLVRILAHRFCFDQTGDTYGNVEHLAYADIDCSNP